MASKRQINQRQTAGKESGFALLDAMVGVLLLLIVGLGTSYWLANGYRQQARSDLKNQIVVKIRENVEAVNGVFGVCGAAPVGSTTINLPANQATIALQNDSGQGIGTPIALTATCNVVVTSPLGTPITDRSLTITTSSIPQLIGLPGSIQVTL